MANNAGRNPRIRSTIHHAKVRAPLALGRTLKNFHSGRALRFLIMIHARLKLAQETAAKHAVASWAVTI
jgi:hypothetical protein